MRRRPLRRPKLRQTARRGHSITHASVRIEATPFFLPQKLVRPWPYRPYHCRRPCFAHSTILHIKDDPYVQQQQNFTAYNLDSNITHRPSIAHALHSFCIQSRWTISTMLDQYSNYIAATHNISHSLRTSKCTTHPPLPTPLPFTTLLCKQLTNTNHICVSGGNWHKK